jgi:hypothetical protein
MPRAEGVPKGIPYALHFMGMSPAARYRHMTAVAKTLSVLDVVPAEGR